MEADSNVKRLPLTAAGSARFLLLCALTLLLVTFPVAAGDATNTSPVGNTTGPELVTVGVFVNGFNHFNVEEGTFEANFFLILSSDTPLSLDDIQIMNGHVTSVETIVDKPGLKNYRITAALTTSPDLHRYPFDRHTLSLQLKPKYKPEKEMIFVIDTKRTGLESEAVLPGWEYRGTSASISNKTFTEGGESYSRAIFNFGVERDKASTILKFFLPIMLIIIVSLGSLLMKVSSRLGLNASMFLAAVLIHWRISDSIPLVGYATFLDMFMIITYATLVMVLMSGILIMKFTESKDPDRAEKVYYWSLRLIPPLTITLYFLLFISIVV